MESGTSATVRSAAATMAAAPLPIRRAPFQFRLKPRPVAVQLGVAVGQAFSSSNMTDTSRAMRSTFGPGVAEQRHF